MPPRRAEVDMKDEASADTPSKTQADNTILSPTRRTVLLAPTIDTTSTSPTSDAPARTPTRRVSRLKCPKCNDYPEGFRSEHELRRHTNRVHRRTRKVWVTFDSSADKTFLANCKACQSGKRYNECYNAASHLRRMHFHPHKRGERKMSAAEARKGGKREDRDPPMDELKANWLREVEEEVGGEADDYLEDDRTAFQQSHSQPRTLHQPQTMKTDGNPPRTPTTPSIRSMAIDSIVDKVHA